MTWFAQSGMGTERSSSIPHQPIRAGTGVRGNDPLVERAGLERLTPVGEVTARIPWLDAAERIIERRLLQSLDLASPEKGW